MSLAAHLASRLAEDFEIEIDEDQVQTYITEHEAPKAKKAAAKSKTTTKKTSDDKHACAHLVNGKDGARICGANAKNELNGEWFCGTDKSGHYKTHLSKTEKSAPAKKAPKATSGPAKAKQLVDKVVKKEGLDLHEVPAGSGVWVDLKHHRIVVDPDTEEVVGVLDEDNETILPLTKKASAFAEAHNLTIREAKKAPKGKAVAPAKTSAKTPTKKAPVAKAAPPAKTPAKKAPVAKAAAKAAPPAKTPAKKAPVATAKAVPPAKGKKAPAKKVQFEEEEEEVLEDLIQEVAEAEVEGEEEEVEVEVEEEPKEEEEPEENVDEDEGGDIDLGDDVEEEPEVEENNEDEDEDVPDIEEEDDGEAPDDVEEEEEEEEE